VAKDVLIFAEQREGKFRHASSEAVSEGKRCAQKLGSGAVALVVGKDVSQLAKELGKYGADRILTADSEIFASYNSESYARAVVNAAKVINPQILILTASSMGRDLAPNVGAKLEVPVASDCIKLDIIDGKLQALRPVYAGKVRIRVAFAKEPNIVTLRPKLFEATEVAGHNVQVEKLQPAIEPQDLKATLKEVVKSVGAKLDLTEADIIVSGGRGMKAAENFKVIEELAQVVGGVVGASRAAVDAGWRPHHDQVGQTGKTVSPTLYIACGISGAIQHLAGMSSSKCIVAINRDPDAPIFQVADYGIVGDLFEVVPTLAQELKKAISR
jgi:electron transfer flavoprotein alpha subunit